MESYCKKTYFRINYFKLCSFRKWLAIALFSNLFIFALSPVSSVNFNYRNLLAVSGGVPAGIPTYPSSTVGDFYRIDDNVRFIVSGINGGSVSTIGMTRIFEGGGLPIYEASSGCLNVQFTVFTDLNVYYVGCLNQNLIGFKGVKIAGNTAVQQISTLSGPHNKQFTLTRAKTIPSSVYLVATGQSPSPNLEVLKHDTTLSDLTTARTTTLTGLQSLSLILSTLTKVNILYVFGSFNSIYSIDTSTMNIVKILNHGVYTDTGGYDKNTDEHFVVSYLSVSPFTTTLKKIDYTGMTTATTLQSLDLAGVRMGNLVLFEKYPYILTTERDNAAVRIYGRTYLNLLMSPLSQPKIIWDSCIASYMQVESQFGLGFVRSVAPIVFSPASVNFGYCMEVTSDTTASNVDCTKCSFGYYLNPSKACIQVPRGFGLNLATFGIKPCGTGCDECFKNYMICEKCLFIEGYFQDPTTLNCIYKDNIPDYYGSDLVTGMIGPCLVTKCMRCRADRRFCDYCDQTFFLSTEDKNCHENNRTGYGLTFLSGQYKVTRCSNPYCEDCKDDYQTCIKCLPYYYFIAKNDTSSCYLNTFLGYGPREVTWLERCLDPNCAQCFGDYLNCQQCNTGYMIVEELRSLTICKPIPKMTLDFTYFDEKSITAIIKFTEVLADLDYINLLTFKIHDHQGVSFTGFTVKSYHYDTSRKSIIIGFSFQQSCFRCSLTILPGSGTFLGTHNQVFTDPVTIGPITISLDLLDSLFDLRNVALFTKAAGSALQVVYATLLFLGLTRVQLVKIVDEFEIFLYLNGNRLKTTDSFVLLFSYEFWSIIPNVLHIPESSVKCTPTINFFKEGKSCNVLNNEGSKILGMAVVFVIIVLLRLSYNFISSYSLFKGSPKERPEAKITLFPSTNIEESRLDVIRSSRDNKAQSQRVRVSTQKIPTIELPPRAKPPPPPVQPEPKPSCLSSLLSLSTVYRLYDGSQIEMALFSMLNVGTANGSLAQWIGLLISILVLGGYILLGKGMISCITTVTKLSRTSPNDLITLDRATLGNMHYIYAEYKPYIPGKSSFFILLLPLIGLIRNMSIQYFVAYLAGSGISQLWLMVIIELGNVILISTIRPYMLTLKNAEEIISRVCLLSIYLVYTLYQYIPSPGVSTVRLFSWLLLILFFSIILASLVPLLIIVCRALIGLMRPKNKVANAEAASIAATRAQHDVGSADSSHNLRRLDKKSNVNSVHPELAKVLQKTNPFNEGVNSMTELAALPQQNFTPQHATDTSVHNDLTIVKHKRLPKLVQTEQASGSTKSIATLGHPHTSRRKSIRQTLISSRGSASGPMPLIDRKKVAISQRTQKLPPLLHPPSRPEM